MKAAPLAYLSFVAEFLRGQVVPLLGHFPVGFQGFAGPGGQILEARVL